MPPQGAACAGPSLTHLGEQRGPELGAHAEKPCLPREEERQEAVGSHKMPERLSPVALSCQGPVAQSPVSQLSGLMSVLSLVVREAGCSKGLRGPSPPQAAGKAPAPACPGGRGLRGGGWGPGGVPSMAPCMGSGF